MIMYLSSQQRIGKLEPHSLWEVSINNLSLFKRVGLSDGIKSELVRQEEGDALATVRLEHIGFMFQAFNLFPALNAEENVALVLRLKGFPRATRRQEARRLLELITLRSPIDGMVIRRYMDPGEGVTAKLPILRIADMGQLRVNAEVDETDVGRVKVSDPVEVRCLAFPGQVFMGKVERLSDMAGGRRQSPNDPTANLAMKVLAVRIVLDKDTPLCLGMSVDVRILSGR